MKKSSKKKSSSNDNGTDTASKKKVAVSAKPVTTNGKRRRKTVTSRTKVISLSAGDRGEFGSLDESLNLAKISLAEVQISIMKLESQRLELAERVVKLGETLMEKAKGAAVLYGIPVDDPSKGRWRLNPKDGVFTRLE